MIYVFHQEKSCTVNARERWRNCRWSSVEMPLSSSLIQLMLTWLFKAWWLPSSGTWVKKRKQTYSDFVYICFAFGRSNLCQHQQGVCPGWNLWQVCGETDGNRCETVGARRRHEGWCQSGKSIVCLHFLQLFVYILPILTGASDQWESVQEGLLHGGWCCRSRGKSCFGYNFNIKNDSISNLINVNHRWIQEWHWIFLLQADNSHWHQTGHGVLPRRNLRASHLHCSIQEWGCNNSCNCLLIKSLITVILGSRQHGQRLPRWISWLLLFQRPETMLEGRQETWSRNGRN